MTDANAASKSKDVSKLKNGSDIGVAAT